MSELRSYSGKDMEREVSEMAIRWSGDLKINIKVNEADREGWLYDCTVSVPKCHCSPKCKPKKVQVRMAQADKEKYAEDNPVAFDKIAQSAISFVVDEHEEEYEFMSAHSCTTEDGNNWFISRREAGSWEPLLGGSDGLPRG